MKYYKGYLFDKNNLESKYINVAFSNGKILNSSDKDFYEIFKLFSLEEKELLDNFFSIRKDRNIEFNADVINILKKVYANLNLQYQYLTSIIYELIEGKDGNLYGKELITGNIFPIANKKDMLINIDSQDIIKRLYMNNKNDSRESVIYDRKAKDDSNTFYSPDNRKYYLLPYISKICIYEHIDQNDDKFPIIKDLGEYSERMGVLFKLKYSFNIIFSNLERGEIFIDNRGIANTIEIQEYEHQYQKKIFNYRRRQFINMLNICAKQNVFKEDIIPKTKEEKDKIEIDDTTKIMERIEYSLIRLKNYNPRQYTIYKKRYEELMYNDDKKLRLTVNKAVLDSIEAGILMCFQFDKNNGSNILEYLENTKNEYLSNLKNDNFDFSLSIEDIDKIMELYLKMQNDYDIVNKRKIIRNIALLYLLLLIKNKNIIDRIDFENSYINDNLLTILIWINTLKEENIINCSKLIDLSYDYNINDILEIIKSIEINNLDSDKIKRL